MDCHTTMGHFVCGDDGIIECETWSSLTSRRSQPQFASRTCGIPSRLAGRFTSLVGGGSVHDRQAYMHTERKITAFVFGTTCLLSVVFAFVAILRPDTRLFALILLPLCIFLAVGSGYRYFFFSDDWYQIRAEKEAHWWNQHPRLGKFVVILWVIGLVCHLVHVFNKHH
jgi:hypothetical protein